VTPTFDVGDHPKLSEASQKLNRELFDSEARIAELELGLAGHSFSGDDEEDARLAIVLRLNRNTARDQNEEGADKFVKREKRGSQEVEYEERAEVRAQANLPKVTPEEDIADRLLGAANWPTIPTQR
jgi:hypothetical protein